MQRFVQVAFLGLLSLTAWAQDPAASTYVKIATSQGDLYLELYREKAPETVANFLKYAEDGFYNGTIFHRVIPNFVIQGGGFDADFQRKDTREPIPNEADNGLANARGTIAMARTADPHSATSQFFINVADNAALDHTGKTHSRAWGYAVFGRVISGMDTIDAIRAIPTGPGGPFHSDVPQEAVVIEAVEPVATIPSNDKETEAAAEAAPESS